MERDLLSRGSPLWVAAERQVRVSGLARLSQASMPSCSLRHLKASCKSTTSLRQGERATNKVWEVVSLSSRVELAGADAPFVSESLLTIVSRVYFIHFIEYAKIKLRSQFLK
jgi:hypothetical protein